MIVVADTSPLNYLVLIGHVDVLPQLYGRVVVPAAVAAELADPASPPAVRSWASTPPHWLDVRRVDVPAGSGLDSVDAGEAEAIVLAETLRPDVLLMIDDRDGRKEAARRGIPTTGLLGVLQHAAERGRIDLAEALDRLSQTSFRASPLLIRELLERERLRRERS